MGEQMKSSIPKIYEEQCCRALLVVERLQSRVGEGRPKVASGVEYE
jgi:hypothetical protein